VTCRQAAALAVLVSLPGSARALDPQRAVTQYRLDGWGVRDALPAHTITGIAQTPDGYLWFASKGLVRFDGMTFTPIDLTGGGGPAPQVLSLVPSAEGGLWLITVPLGLLHYKDGVIRRGAAVSASGALFPARDGGLWQLAGEGATEAVHIGGGGVDHRVPILQARSMLEEADGTLWFGGWDATRGGLTRRHGAEVEHYGREQGIDMFVSSIIRARDGTLWIGTRRGLTSLRDGRFKTYTTADGLSDDYVTVLMEDRDGNLWIGTSSGGVSRWSGGAFSTMRQSDGLVDDYVSALKEDDEGGIWVAGRGALGRLRNTSFATYTTREGLPVDTMMQTYAAKDGGVWVGTYGGGLCRFKDGRVTTYGEKAGVPNLFVGAVFESRDGSVWFGEGSNQLVRVRGGKVEVIDTGKRYPWAIAEDEGGLVISVPREGLFRRQGRALVPYPGAEALTRISIRTLLPARDGSLWIGTSRGVVHAQGGRFTAYGEAEGLKGTVFSLLEDDDGTLWIGGSTGLARLVNGHIATFPGHPYLSDNSVPALVDDGEGALWFNSTNGLGRVAKADLDARAEKTARGVPVRVFTAKDGLKVEEVRTTPVPQRASRSADGRLWFPTTRGVAVVDPRRLMHDAKRPPLVIEEVWADGRVQPARGEVDLPPGAGMVEVRYTALSYTLPERVTFRYRLVGFDPDWVMVGSRRSAHYTKLPPGRYRFELRAANSDGVETETAAVLTLRQEPQFHQTVWFRLMLAAGALLVVTFGHQLRVAQLRAHERELNVRVEAALAQIKTLHGLLPMCASCKKIRDDTGYWNHVENYIHDHSSAELSHGICPDCLHRLYPDYVDRIGEA
jgi:ligand-binding sensor domain-containing protein